MRRAVTSAEKQEPPGVVAPAARLSSSRVDWPAQPSLDLAQNYFSRISWVVSIVLLPPLPVAILALFVHWDDIGAPSSLQPFRERRCGFHARQLLFVKWHQRLVLQAGDFVLYQQLPTF